MSKALTDLRVLDLTDATGQYCGKMFGDLGADVILVEPPGEVQLACRRRSWRTASIRITAFRSPTTTPGNGPSAWICQLQ
ncbi:CoA transferase [Polaromonas sp. P1-6]|nr:CoA transferase [Polaromonas sp. P1-6]